MFKALILMTALLAPDPAVVKVRVDGGGFCSGVCVSPDGYILTAEHCGCSGGAEIEFPDGRKFKAVSVYDPPKNNIDEASLLKIANQSGLPFHPVADVEPRNGDNVISRGYPKDQYVEMKGKISIVASAILVDGMKPDFGNSGGPLLNEREEVIGICSGFGASEKLTQDIEVLGGLNTGRWISWKSIKTAMEPLGQVERFVLNVLTRDPCPPCDAFKEDATRFRDLRSMGVAVRYVEYDEGKHSGYPTPAFWLSKPDGTNVKIATTSGEQETAHRYGYDYRNRQTAWKDICEWVRGTLRLPLSAAEAIEETIPKPNLPPPPPKKYERAEANAPVSIDPLPPVPAEEPPAPLKDDGDEWSGVTIVVAASTKVPTALRLVESRVKRTVASISKGKARLKVIAQSTSPDAFEEYQDFAGEVGSIHVSILIPKRDVGLAAGLLVKQVESKVRDLLDSKLPEKLHIEEVFQRLTPDDYDLVLDLADRADEVRPQADGSNQQGLIATIMTAVGSLLAGGSLGGFVKGWLARRAARKVTE